MQKSQYCCGKFVSIAEINENLARRIAVWAGFVYNKYAGRAHSGAPILHFGGGAYERSARAGGDLGQIRLRGRAGRKRQPLRRRGMETLPRGGGEPYRRPGPARERRGVPQHTPGQRPAHRRSYAHNAERIRHSAPHGLSDGPDRRRGLCARDDGRREHHDQDPRPALHPRRALGQPERGHQRDKRRPGLQHRHTDGRSRALLPHAPRLDLLRRAHTRL